jgi:hypothetical protein
LSRNQLRIMTGLLAGHCHFRGCLFKLVLVGSSRCERYKQTFETASHVLCDCETLAVLRLQHLGHYFLKPGYLADISVRKVIHFVQSVGLLNTWAEGRAKDRKQSRCKGHSSACANVLSTTFDIFGGV